MHLAYSFEDKIFWIKNFLPYHLYKNIHNSVIKNNKHISQDAKEIWPEHLLNNLETPQRLTITETVSEQYKTFLKHQPFINLINTNPTYIIHKMTKFSGINWHSDTDYEYAATFYINKNWHVNWGGEFMFKTETQSGFIPIVGNSLILIKSPLVHKVNPVLSSNTPRFSIQSFFLRKV